MAAHFCAAGSDMHERAGAGGVGLGLLAEQPVGDLAGARGRRQVRGEPGQPAARTGPDRLLGHPEQIGELAVAPALAENQLDGGALVGRQGVERGGAAARRHTAA